MLNISSLNKGLNPRKTLCYRGAWRSVPRYAICAPSFSAGNLFALITPTILPPPAKTSPPPPPPPRPSAASGPWTLGMASSILSDCSSARLLPLRRALLPQRVPRIRPCPALASSRRLFAAARPKLLPRPPRMGSALAASSAESGARAQTCLLRLNVFHLTCYCQCGVRYLLLHFWALGLLHGGREKTFRWILLVWRNLRGC